MVRVFYVRIGDYSLAVSGDSAISFWFASPELTKECSRSRVHRYHSHGFFPRLKNCDYVFSVCRGRGGADLRWNSYHFFHRPWPSKIGRATGLNAFRGSAPYPNLEVQIMGRLDPVCPDVVLVGSGGMMSHIPRRS